MKAECILKKKSKKLFRAYNCAFTKNDKAGLESNRFYFCWYVVADISLLSLRFCLHSLHCVGSVEKVMSLTFGRKKIYICSEMCCWWKKRFLKSTVHIPKQSLMIHPLLLTPHHLIKGIANYTSHIIQELRYPRYFQYTCSGYFPNNE